jgi:hypothetical protein
MEPGYHEKSTMGARAEALIGDAVGARTAFGDLDTVLCGVARSIKGLKGIPTMKMREGSESGGFHPRVSRTE